MDHLHDKRVLVTGCCGSIGSALIDVLITSSDDSVEVVGLDHNESALFFMAERYRRVDRASFFVADIRDRDTLSNHCRGIDLVFHLAALKHVILCEQSPFDAVQSNVIGVQNVIHAAMENDVAKVIFTSSDKAVNPTSVMGTSKLMGERLITAANSTRRQPRTVFASTRFGNVLGSNGSVVLIFRRQIAAGGPVTLTDAAMTRFIMSQADAVRLVLNSASLALGGEVFVTKMPSVRITDLARVMIEELAPRYGFAPQDIQITEIGAKPGEKLYEELMSDEETRRAIGLPEYFAILPAFRNLYGNIEYRYSGCRGDPVSRPYLSAQEAHLNADQLRILLDEAGLLSLQANDVGDR